MKCIFSIICLFFLSSLFAETIDVTKYGAKGNGKKVNTMAIQKAIDECSSKKGGTVLIPTGEFVTGTLYLKSNVTLLLDKGALLIGSVDSADYPFNQPITVLNVSTHNSNGKPKPNLALIYAESQENISIVGEGKISGNGNHPFFQRGDNGANRPKIILFISCNNVLVKNITLTNSAFWTQDYLGCDGVRIQGINVYNHSNWNQDGIDIDSKNVVVSDCRIDSDDDGICLKSYLIDKPCENVTITNCVIGTNCNGIKFGTPGYGGFKNIAITNCVIKAASESNFRNWTKRYSQISTDPSMVSGISLECADGGNVDGIVINNITMRATQTPIFIRASNRIAKLKSDTAKHISSLKNVIISNIIAEQHSRRSSSITAYPGVYTENININNYLVTIFSGANKEQAEAKNIPENEDKYPSTHMYGDVLPASGFFVRHVKNLTLDNIQINKADTDTRIPIWLDDVLTADIRNIVVKDLKTGNTKRVNENDVKVVNSKDVVVKE